METDETCKQKCHRPIVIMSDILCKVKGRVNSTPPLQKILLKSSFNSSERKGKLEIHAAFDRLILVMIVKKKY